MACSPLTGGQLKIPNDDKRHKFENNKNQPEKRQTRKGSNYGAVTIWKLKKISFMFKKNVFGLVKFHFLQFIFQEWFFNIDIYTDSIKSSQLVEENT